MALIKCPECGKEISDKAQACPNCGFCVVYRRKPTVDHEHVKKMQEEKKSKLKSTVLVVIGVAIFICVYLIWYETASVGVAARRLKRSEKEYLETVDELNELEKEKDELDEQIRQLTGN